MSESTASLPADPASNIETKRTTDADTKPTPAKEIGGRDGLEPTRYGDWEKNGRCIDF